MKRAKKTKIPRVLGPDFLPHAEDPALAQRVSKELDPLIDALREDVQKYDTLTDRARLSRTLIQRGELELLCGTADRAPQDFEEADALLRRDDRDAPRMLVDARRAWANILRQEPARAASTLRDVLAVDDVTVRGWRDQLLLWLAAAYVALDDRDAAIEQLREARAIYAQEPRRDRRLVDAAWNRLGGESNDITD